MKRNPRRRSAVLLGVIAAEPDTRSERGATSGPRSGPSARPTGGLGGGVVDLVPADEAGPSRRRPNRQPGRVDAPALHEERAFEPLESHGCLARIGRAA